MPCRLELDMLSQVYSHNEDANWHAKPASAVQLRLIDPLKSYQHEVLTSNGG